MKVAFLQVIGALLIVWLILAVGRKQSFVYYQYSMDGKKYRIEITEED